MRVVVVGKSWGSGEVTAETGGTNTLTLWFEKIM
jgi:hypothetical protein